MVKGRIVIFGDPEKTKPLFGKYRKRPVVIEAARMDVPFQVHTLEGTMEGNPGDWLIKGVEGELYPCKDSVFQATYEAVEDGA
jgi:hypothetical protein